MYMLHCHFKQVLVQVFHELPRLSVFNSCCPTIFTQYSNSFWVRCILTISSAVNLFPVPAGVIGDVTDATKEASCHTITVEDACQQEANRWSASCTCG